MNATHRSVFETFQRGVDRGLPVQALRAELHDHLAGCPDCRLDIELHQELKAEAALRWPATLEPQRPAAEILAAMRAQVDRNRRRQLIFRPLRVTAWVVLVILLVMGVNWAIANLRPQPAVTPVPSAVEEVAPPPDATTPKPEDSENEIPRITLQPFAAGAGTTGGGLWSPDSEWFFFELVESGDDPRSDRRYTTLNFLNPGSGEVCQQPQKLLGVVHASNLVRWLPGNRLLFTSWWEEPPGAPPAAGRTPDNGTTFVSGSPGVYLITPCDDEILNLDDRFSEAILSTPTWRDSGPQVVLRGETHFWLLDPDTLTTRPLEQPLPSPDGGDSQAWSPSGEQLAILHPAPGSETERSLLTILGADSGLVVRSLELATGDEYGSPMLQWLLEDKLYVWASSETGPILVDLAGEQPEVIFVLPELFGLQLPYPTEFSASSAVADESAGTYHLAFKVNTAADKDTYIYHSERDEVEKLPVEGHTYLIYPDGDFEPLFQWEDEPTYTDEFDLVWVDDPEKGTQRLSVVGHTPRNYPILWPRLVPNREQIAFASSQGLSLVSIPDGQLLGFWRLEGGGDPGPPAVSSDGRFLVVASRNPDNDQSAPGGAFYLIPLEP